MRVQISLDCPAGPEETDGPARIGWLLSKTAAGVLYDPPQRVRSGVTRSSHAKSASKCPAILGLENRLFEIKCPFDLKLEFSRCREGYPTVRDGLNEFAGIRQLDEVLKVVAEDEWRHPDRPLLQLVLPYIFVADEGVHMSQLAPFLHYQSEPLPGIMLGGRFPINVWPRPLMWAFEWHDTERPITLRRGKPLFYVQFETTPQNRGVQLVEARRTADLDAYLELIAGAVNYVNQTFSLFDAAEKRRPARLVVPVER